MKCSKCGFENKDKAKFCTKCGNSLAVEEPQPTASSSGNSKMIIFALIAIIIILAGTIGYFALSSNSGNVQSDDASQSAGSSENKSVDNSDDKDDESDSAKTTTVSSSKSSSSSSDSKDWVSIGSYSGSGSGSQTINVPAGKIMVKLSAYPIKNYATNHLYVSGSNGQSGGVDWGSKSAVETRSDSFTFTSSSEEVFTIDYYETVSWEVEFFRYQ
ncbi:zinc ribbon domain-containing protein [uncultured Methanobrevibacter sp.]|uniref:zinc ribbon domain-containing protein n=1 Tax=uncultured Methanobrevibacter sp. TaxID=253161 RepID=UPI0025E15549|nr:zinc ribbon domain-containing protein [uncultured Methanobrevibacter sp.]